MENLFPALYGLLGALLPFPFAEPMFMKRAILATLLVAPVAAAMGVPLVHHRMAFFSDAIGHSAFTGVAIGVLLGISPTLTMVAFGLAVAFGIARMKERTGLSADTVIGVFFSFVIALGIAILSATRGLSRSLPAFLYGDLLAITERDLLSMAALLFLAGGYLAAAYNRILLLGVNEGLARSMGVPARRIEVSFSLAVALVVTLAIRAVGILLVTALLVIPAASARNVARGAAPTFWIAVGTGLFSGLAGIVLSFHLDVATGAAVVLCAATLFALTALIRAARR